MSFEADLIRFLQTNASNGWITFFQVVTMLGSYLGFLIAFVIIFFKNKSLGIAFALTFAFGCVANFALKLLIARKRPFDEYSFIQNLGGEDGFSMPSGHSVCAGMFATFLIYLLFSQTKNTSTRVWGTICLSLFPVLIGFSRIILGVHYLSDVIVGIILGIIFAILGIWLYNRVIKNKVKVRMDK